MPILHDKLVIKSIEALHDEALSLVPDNVSRQTVNSSPDVLRAAAPPQDSLTNVPKGTSADAPLESANDHDIMARIDRLLRKLDEDDDIAIAPPPKKGALSRAANILGDTNDGDTDDNSDDILPDDQQGETVPPSQTQALADIAEAIYRARQQSDDPFAAEANQSGTTPFDMSVLSETVAVEVRRTVSAVIIAELPKVVRNAVDEAIRALPTNTRDQSSPAAVKPSAAKSVALQKTAATSKAGSKKAGTKTTVTKTASGKTTPKKKLSVKKRKAKKVLSKKAADIKAAR